MCKCCISAAACLHNFAGTVIANTTIAKNAPKYNAKCIAASKTCGASIYNNAPTSITNVAPAIKSINAVTYFSPRLEANFPAIETAPITKVKNKPNDNAKKNEAKIALGNAAIMTPPSSKITPQILTNTAISLRPLTPPTDFINLKPKPTLLTTVNKNNPKTSPKPNAPRINVGFFVTK